MPPKVSSGLENRTRWVELYLDWAKNDLQESAGAYYNLKQGYGTIIRKFYSQERHQYSTDIYCRMLSD